MFASWLRQVYTIYFTYYIIFLYFCILSLCDRCLFLQLVHKAYFSATRINYLNPAFFHYCARHLFKTHDWPGLDGVGTQAEGVGHHRRQGGYRLHPPAGPHPLPVRDPAGPCGAHPGQGAPPPDTHILSLAGTYKFV